MKCFLFAADLQCIRLKNKIKTKKLMYSAVSQESHTHIKMISQTQTLPL